MSEATTQDILIHTEAGVCTITLNRVGKKNSLTQAMYATLAEALAQAEAALEGGLVNRVVPPTECNAVAQAQARKLAAKPLSSLVETKRLMKKGQQAPVLERMAEEGASFGRMLREPAAREAFTAFMEKRLPDFSKV